MKLWHAAVLVVLLMSIITLTACDIFGSGRKRTQEQERFEQQLKAIQEQQEANERYQQEQKEYYEQIQKALEDYYKQYEEYQQAQVEAQLQQQGATSNQSGGQ
jgi:predicted metalloprotease